MHFSLPISLPTLSKNRSKSVATARSAERQSLWAMEELNTRNRAIYRSQSQPVVTQCWMPENQISGAVNRRVVGSNPT